jgi:putative membrane-bound dehydrogenase-like protein
LAAGFASRLFAAEPQVDPAQLPRVPATPPERAVSTFKVKPGFRIELVAAEPLVVDPIAMSFDEDGRCYVVEMRDYSERRPERLGRIRLLEDTDGDGRFDKSTVFAQDLPWPTAVICWEGGVFVGATPDIIYFKDTNRDGVADIREVIFSGFASDYAPFATNKLNVQAMFNSFNWSLDNRIHGASGGSGGQVRRFDSPFTREWIGRAGVTLPSGTQTPPAVDLRGKDFSFDPRTLELRAESGGAQHGLTFDNAGRKFVCSNSDHIQQVIYEERYIGRNAWFTLPSPRISIAADGPAAPVYRISPDEPWRVLRTQWRVAGVVPGPIEGGGRPSGYFTGATGVTIYRGDALGEDFVGDAFIADCGSNLVHRKKLRSSTNRLALIAERDPSEQSVEFLASTDNWFRPVQFANAPDGALYICDMYREVIEHPWSLPESIKKHLDLNSGNDMGRIYRIVPENFKQRPRPHLGRLSSMELAQILEHPNGWHRETAARLLYQRQDTSAIPALIELTVSGTTLGQLHTLYALKGMGALKETFVTVALNSPDPFLRMHALRMSELFAAQPPDRLVGTMASLAGGRNRDAGSLAVDFQLAWTLGRFGPSDRSRIADQLFERLKRDNLSGPNQIPIGNQSSAWFLPALMNAFGNDPAEVIRRIMKYSTPTLTPSQLATTGIIEPSALRSLLNPDEQQAIISSLGKSMGARNASNELQQALVELEWIATYTPGRRLGFEFISSLAEGLEASGDSLAPHLIGMNLTNRLLEARRIAFDKMIDFETADRLPALKVVASMPDASDRTNLLALTTAPAEPSAVRLAALAALNRPALGDTARDVVQRWPQLLPAQRAATIDVFLKRVDRTRALLAGVESGVIRAGEFSIVQQTALRSHRDAGIRKQATSLLGKVETGSREQTVEKFRPTLNLKGSLANGQRLFAARCAACHKLGAEGQALGPDLASVRGNGKEKLLVSILDPNREVAPQFASYLVETRDGESFSGLIVNESANSVTLRMSGGAESVVARANIASLQSQGKSLMPEGLEEGLSQQDMADLLEFIVATP